jgi:hypothetical protein
MMMTTIVVGLMAVAPLAGQRPAAALPDTPQGKQVAAYIAAYNTGNEQAFLDVQERLLGKAALARRDRQERAALYRKMRAEFPTIVVARVVKATSLTIALAVPTVEGEEASMVFDLEDSAPYRIAAIGVEIEAKGGRGN